MVSAVDPQQVLPGQSSGPSHASTPVAPPQSMLQLIEAGEVTQQAFPIELASTEQAAPPHAAIGPPAAFFCRMVPIFPTA